jgi:hypothetical protein
LLRLRIYPKASKALVYRGFSVVVWEPYTVTLARGGFIADLYTPIVRLGCLHGWREALLECCVGEVEVGNLGAKALSREVWGFSGRLWC